MAKSADRKAAAKPAESPPPPPPSPGRKLAGVIVGIAAQRLLAAGVRRLLRRLR